MGISAVTIYAPDRSILSVALVAAALALVAFPATSLWAWTGTIIRQWLSSAVRLRTFNISMAVMLMLSLYPALGLAD